MTRQFKTIADATPMHCISVHREARMFVGPTHQIFSASETTQLMKMYAHARYIAVQASRSADRCDREGVDRGIVKYLRLMQKAANVCREIEASMAEWESGQRG